MVEAIISVNNLKKTFRTHTRGTGLLESLKSLFVRKFKYVHALKGINFEIAPCEIIGFIGPNGAGKSTAIKIMCGILFPDSGEASCIGFDPWKEREKYVQHIGAVFGQKTQLAWDIPPIDTFYYLKDVYEVPDKEFKKRLDYMIHLLGLKEIVRTPTRNLSLGERMRCELVAALLHGPKLVFLDEPTIGVDIIAKEIIREFILKVNKEEGTTFIITTHDMGDIEKLCARVIVINHGEIIFDGLLDNLKKRYVKSKVVCVKFYEPQEIRTKLLGRVISKTKLELKIEVNPKHINRVIEQILRDYKVADITVTNPPIEEIIAHTYGKK